MEHLGDSVSLGGIQAGAGSLRLELSAGDQTSELRLLWPVPQPEAIFAEATSGKVVGAAESGVEGQASRTPDQDFEQQLKSLPAYVRSLLRIGVPISVQLASVKRPVSRILNIGPGSIIQFERNCEQPLTLSVGNRVVAEGDAVKVGDKFGIRITSMVLPGEKFSPLRGKSR